MNIDDMILRFFRDDVGGVLIVDTRGETIYEDEQSAEIIRQSTNWDKACPPPREGQRGEDWDLPNAAGGKPYTVISSTFIVDGELLQIHHFADNSVYMQLFREINDYSRELKIEKERDGLTGLYNKGKLMELKQSLFRNKDSIAVFNMDVNNLKQVNDTFGHEAGDRLILVAAESLRRIEARNVMTFRTGGDEFMAVALHVNKEEALALRRRWEEGLASLNAAQEDAKCVIACGMAHGSRGYDLDLLFEEADRLMYADKAAKKQGCAGNAR